MNILQTVKYYAPSQGGMESVVQNIVEGVSLLDINARFTVYANNHASSFNHKISGKSNIRVIKEATPLLFKSQPISFFYTKLKSLIEENEIIHHHYPFPNMELALLRNADLLQNKKLIITWHANIKNSRWSFIKKYYNPIIDKLLKLSDHIVVTSPQLYEASDVLDKYEKKVTVIPLSFDPGINGGMVHPKTFPENRKFKLLFVGKLRAYKGVKYLIEAIKNLDVILSIVGDGENEMQLKEQVGLLQIAHKVIFYRNISDAELSDLYQDSDLFVLPSINEAEAFGVVQLEAMSNALPVINTSLDSGVPFVSLNDYSGLTVKPKDVEELKSAIQTIASNKSMFERFSRNSLERSNSFTRQKMSEAYLSLYNS